MSYARTLLQIGAALALAAPRAAWAMPCPDDTSKTCECIHGPVALPALSGPPEWFDVNGDGFYRPTFHDPRWSGAPLELLIAVTDEAQTRILQQGNYIYASYQATGDDQGPDGQDTVYLGITQGSASQAYAVKFPVLGDGTGVAGPPGSPADTPLPEHLLSGVFSYWQSNSSGSFTGALEQTSPLSWIDQIAVWKPPSGSHSPWGVTVRIDKSSTGLNASPGSIRIFLGMNIHKTTGGSSFGNVNPVAMASGVGGTTIIPTDPTTWGRYAEPGTACTSGVTLSSTDVGVFPGSPGTAPTGTLTNRICASDPCPSTTPGGNPDNVFRVIARNVPNGAGIGTWGLRARVRIADWGSTISDWRYAPWKDVSVPTASRPTNPTGTAILTGPSTPLTSANGWYFQANPDSPGSSTSNVVMDYQCDRGTDAYCPKLSDPTESHQCMLVEIGQQGAQFEIANTAVYRNMDYYGLSSLDRPAVISLAGLKQSTGLDGEREVYLHVEELNMPRHGDQPLWLPAEAMKLAATLAQNPPTIPRPPEGKRTATEQKRQDKASQELLARRQKEAVARAAQIASSTQKIGNVPLSSVLSMSPDAILDGVWPTYRVRPYYDSGTTYTEKGKTSKVLVPMAPFGFRLSHDGPFYGFAHALEAADPSVRIDKIGDDWYCVHFKNEASPAHLRTKISAEEKPLHPPGPPAPCPECGKCPECKVEHHGTCGCRLGGTESGSGATAALAILAAALVERRRQARRRA